jgi:hypothetical protein
MTVNGKRIRTGFVDKQTGEVQLNKPDETAQHTPRPWYVAYDLGGGHRGCLIASNGLENGYGIVKGEVHYRTDSDWLEEAAPALLAAAEAVRPYLNRYVGGGRAALDAAIAQAKGAA